MPSLQDFFNVRFVMLTTTVVAYILWVIILISCILEDDGNDGAAHDDGKALSETTTSFFYYLPRPLALYAWSIGQWSVWISPRFSSLLTQKAWRSLEHEQQQQRHDASTISNSNLLEIPTIHVQDFGGNASAAIHFLQQNYGTDWRERPLLLKGLWDPNTLLDDSKNDISNNNQRRRLSPQGLLQMNLTIPYFSDSRIQSALQPDASAPIQEIVQRMLEGHPHKIGTQFIVQEYPSLLSEVAPLAFTTKLFGDYFSLQRLLGHGKTLGIFPGITTVPVFIANGNATSGKVDGSSDDTKQCDNTSDSSETATCSASDTPVKEDTSKLPSTGLHCEPIANVAVQLHGFRKWTLVDPQQAWQLRPAIANDGRSFYPSWATTLDHLPRYEVVTYPGDAVFVPTWTWHRVDYMMESADLSIGASLFHFRAGDYLRRNPLFAILMIPALIRELAGISSQ